jgi:hypothetical protein
MLRVMRMLKRREEKTKFSGIGQLNVNGLWNCFMGFTAHAGL